MRPHNTKKKSASLLSFTCGCRDSKSVSVSASASGTMERSTVVPRRQREPSSSFGDTLTTTSSSVVEREREREREREQEHDDESVATTTFSGLLRELNELEQTVKAWGSSRQSQVANSREESEVDKEAEQDLKRWRRRQRHDRCLSEGRAEESVVVVKDTADPLEDFRQSMLQMIVEKGIVEGTELRDLLRQFLCLNSPIHHGVILRAFAEIWEEIFSGNEDNPARFGLSLPHCHFPRPRLS
ncbi:hypothetical protein HPP92_021923 [Vanilla planifolia]|uniref:Transcription repressor n=1 Tax=Vanilla planifolia TaxID=51239 RepID=A0A835PT31_VANPL|nr:hypothetical protein HPP92_022239 [Vanilla planifolia]KAG0458795.1 hypothetical protein HPP92_021923 [Vanilla planifolia]